MTAIASDLVDAYRATHFTVIEPFTFTLRIGNHTPDLNKAYNDDADSTIKIRAQKWERIKAGAHFPKTATSSYYEGHVYDFTWSISNGNVSIDGEDGVQCVVDLPVEELIRHQLKPGEPT